MMSFIAGGENSFVESSFVESSFVESSFVESSFVESSFVESSFVESSFRALSSETYTALCTSNTSITFITTMVFSCLSVIGSSFIITSWLIMPAHIAYKKLRVLLFFLSVMDLLVGLSYLMSPLVIDTNTNLVIAPSLCTLQATVSTFCTQSSFLTTALIGLHLQVAVTMNGGNNKAARLVTDYSTAIFWTVCCGVPAIFVAIVYGANMFGYSQDFGEQWCWIRTDETTTDERVLLYRILGGKLVEVLSILVIVVTYIRVVIKLRHLHSRPVSNSRPVSSPLNSAGVSSAGVSNSSNKSMGVDRLLFIPLLFIILRLPSFTRLIIDFANPNPTGSECMGWLSLLQSAGDPSQGFVNGLVYVGGSRRVRVALGRFFCGWRVGGEQTVVSSLSESKASGWEGGEAEGGGRQSLGEHNEYDYGDRVARDEENLLHDVATSGSNESGEGLERKLLA